MVIYQDIKTYPSKKSTPEKFYCSKWKHSERRIFYCSNPYCPGMRGYKKNRSLKGYGWEKKE